MRRDRPVARDSGRQSQAEGGSGEREARVRTDGSAVTGDRAGGRIVLGVDFTAPCRKLAPHDEPPFGAAPATIAQRVGRRARRAARVRLRIGRRRAGRRALGRRHERRVRRLARARRVARGVPPRRRDRVVLARAAIWPSGGAASSRSASTASKCRSAMSDAKTLDAHLDELLRRAQGRHADPQAWRRHPEGRARWPAPNGSRR